MRAIGGRIRTLRRSSNLNQRQLAALLHVAHATVAHWEVGDQRIGMDTARRVANLFGVRPDWLLTGREPQHAEAVDDAPAEHWPQDEVRAAWGFDVPPPDGWPEPIRKYAAAALRFALVPSVDNFDRVWAAAGSLNHGDPLPLGLRQGLQSHRGMMDMILTASDAALDAVEDAVRFIIQVKPNSPAAALQHVSDVDDPPRSPESC